MSKVKRELFEKAIEEELSKIFTEVRGDSSFNAAQVIVAIQERIDPLIVKLIEQQSRSTLRLKTKGDFICSVDINGGVIDVTLSEATIEYLEWLESLPDAVMSA